MNNSWLKTSLFSLTSNLIATTNPCLEIATTPCSINIQLYNPTPHAALESYFSCLSSVVVQAYNYCAASSPANSQSIPAKSEQFFWHRLSYNLLSALAAHQVDGQKTIWHPEDFVHACHEPICSYITSIICQNLEPKSCLVCLVVCAQKLIDEINQQAWPSLYTSLQKIIASKTRHANHPFGNIDITR